jgi:hypothetical protein
MLDGTIVLAVCHTLWQSHDWACCMVQAAPGLHGTGSTRDAPRLLQRLTGSMRHEVLHV